MKTEQTQDKPETRPSEVRSDALLDCPFCGSVPNRPTVNNYDGWFYVFCNTCHVKTSTFGVQAGAIEAWNRRQSNKEVTL